MSRDLAKLLQCVNIVAMVILMLVFLDNAIMKYISALVCIGIGIWLNYCLRCPHCGAWPSRGSLSDEYCPRCGNHLDD